MTEARVTPKQNELHDRLCPVEYYLAVLQNEHVHLVCAFKELEIEFHGLLTAEYVTELVKYVPCFLVTKIGHESVRVMETRDTNLGSLW